MGTSYTSAQQTITKQKHLALFIDPFYTSGGDLQTQKNILFGRIFNNINIKTTILLFSSLNIHIYHQLMERKKKSMPVEDVIRGTKQDNGLYFQNNLNYYSITINCNNIIIRTKFNYYFFKSRISSFSCSPNILEKTKIVIEHDFHLDTDFLVEIPSFRNTRYFHRNIQYFKFNAQKIQYSKLFDLKQREFRSKSIVFDRNTKFFT